MKSAWGSQSTRLTRDSFLPFGSCQLCLQIAREPVACASNGEIFCRECAVNNLLSQRKEIKRLEKEFEKGLRETADEDRERDAEERARAVKDFEKTMMGLEEKGNGISKELTKSTEASDTRGTKRKHGIDEEEMLKNAREERTKARKAIDDEKAAEPKLPSFWVPSLTPSTKTDRATEAPPKLHPLCPASSPTNKHSISLKSLITVNFKLTKDSGPVSQGPIPTCPACIKVLNNTNKAVMTVPCGHVLCKPCSSKLMSLDTGLPDPHASAEKQADAKRITCYICSTDLTAPGTQEKDEKRKTKKDSKAEVKPGLVELKCDGTGFAGGGDNMVQKHGTAFQC